MANTRQGVQFSRWDIVYFPLSGVSWTRGPRPTVIKPRIMVIAIRLTAINGSWRVRRGARSQRVTEVVSLSPVLWCEQEHRFAPRLRLIEGEIMWNRCRSWGRVPLIKLWPFRHRNHAHSKRWFINQLLGGGSNSKHFQHFIVWTSVIN